MNEKENAKNATIDARRLSEDDYFMEIAMVVSKRSTCLKKHVGAILVKEKRIISTGYNGAPKSLPHCIETGCERIELGAGKEELHNRCRGVHAEQNAIIQAAVTGISIKNAILYTTVFPCMACSKLILNADIKEVVYIEPYDMENEIKMKMFEQKGIKIRQWKPSEK
ncbi:MAG: deoxycytidylate deaminase [Candidatus Helarchaeota archaeon]